MTPDMESKEVMELVDAVRAELKTEYRENLETIQKVYESQLLFYRELLRTLAVWDAKRGDVDFIDNMLTEATEGFYKVGYYNGYRAGWREEDPEFDLDDALI